MLSAREIQSKLMVSCPHTNPQIEKWIDGDIRAKLRAERRLIDKMKNEYKHLPEGSSEKEKYRRGINTMEKLYDDMRKRYRAMYSHAF